MPHDANDPLETLTMNDVCRILKVSKKTAYRLMIEWKIRILRSGRLVRIFRVDLESAISERIVHW
jgi:excisionase family DNA binding protein